MDLTTRFSDYRAANPKARIRTAAHDLGATEAELVATGVDGPATPLASPDGGWRALLPELETLGDVMALTRNDACVHERHGVYSGADIALPHGMALFPGADIDLRLFCARWASAFAVETVGRSQMLVNSAPFRNAREPLAQGFKRVGGNRDDGRNVVEDQKRRDQKAAAHAEHARQKADGRTHPENDEDIHR